MRRCRCCYMQWHQGRASSPHVFRGATVTLQLLGAVFNPFFVHIRRQRTDVVLSCVLFRSILRPFLLLRGGKKARMDFAAGQITLILRFFGQPFLQEEGGKEIEAPIWTGPYLSLDGKPGLPDDYRQTPLTTKQQDPVHQIFVKIIIRK